MIGILRWMIELGRIDICMEVSLISRYLVGPRTGHLVQVLHIFSFLKFNQCMDICYDPRKLNITEPTQERASPRAKIISTMYPNAIEDLPPDYPEPLGKSL